MSLYEGIKDVAKIVQQADNIELYKQLLDLGAQALDMQSEISRLRAENEDLRKEKSQRDDIVYHQNKQVDELLCEHPYITLKSDAEGIRYCAICWGRDKKLIPLYDELNCLVCLENRGKRWK